MIRTKRIYEQPATGDGARILVDRLWPRGMSKERAAVAIWLKEIAPSTALRIWFGHRPERFSTFKAKYIEELLQNPETAELRALTAKESVVTLLYAAKDPSLNNAVVLKEFLEG